MITLPSNAIAIDENFEYTPGVLLTPQITLDALTRGDYSTNSQISLQRTSPLFIDFDTIQFDPFVTGRPPVIDAKWKIAANLQYLAYGIVQPLLNYFSPIGLQFISAYLDPERAAPDVQFSQSKHFSGEAVTFSVTSNLYNAYSVLGDVLYVLQGNVVEVGLMFSQTSWFHIGIQGPYTNPNYPGYGTYDEPRIFTRDLVSGEGFTGFMPCRGVA